MKVLLIEDDLNLGQGTLLALRSKSIEAVWVRRLAEASKTIDFARSLFDAVVLDLGLPDGDGMEWLRQQRAKELSLPILILSARDALHHRVRGLDEGADDYLVKPFALDELVSRLHALVRRARGNSKSTLSHRGLAMDPAAMTATLHGHALALSQTEYQLLLMLLRQVGRVITRTQLEGCALAGAESNSLDMHMSNLRRKIGANLIRTVRGVGYIIDDQPLAASCDV